MIKQGGTPSAEKDSWIVNITPDAFARFKSKVAIGGEDDCWLWTDTLYDGYGRFCIGKRFIGAHRASYILAKGVPPLGALVDHECRNRACVNPKHLRALTSANNVLIGQGISAKNALKTHCKRDHPLSGDNLYIKPNGDRACKACQSQSGVVQAAKRKAQRQAIKAAIAER